jgi:hypothetical protein
LQVTIALLTALAAQASAEVTAAQVNAAIANGMAFLEKQQQPGGNWPELAAEPGGVTALCTLALLNSGRTPSDPSGKKALEYLERHEEPARTYSTSLFIMAFTQADPKKTPKSNAWRGRGEPASRDNEPRLMNGRRTAGANRNFASREARQA